MFSLKRHANSYKPSLIGTEGGQNQVAFTKISAKPESEDRCGGNQDLNPVPPRPYAMNRRSSVPSLFRGKKENLRLSLARHSYKRHCKEPWDRRDQPKERVEPIQERALADPL